jgi:hypothetical protein
MAACMFAMDDASIGVSIRDIQFALKSGALGPGGQGSSRLPNELMTVFVTQTEAAQNQSSRSQLPAPGARPCTQGIISRRSIVATGIIQLMPFKHDFGGIGWCK